MVSSSPPGTAIAKYAKENKIDLIVVAGHGRNSVGALFLGSTVQRILSEAPLPGNGGTHKIRLPI